MTKPSITPAGEPPVLTTVEAAKLLRLSTVYLRKLAREGTGPRQTRVGRRVLYRRVDLLAWIDSKAG